MVIGGKVRVAGVTRQATGVEKISARLKFIYFPRR